MINSAGAKASDFHCIGHSLGSHICGYAGSRILGLGKITGLDPAGFENRFLNDSNLKNFSKLILFQKI